MRKANQQAPAGSIDCEFFCIISIILYHTVIRVMTLWSQTIQIWISGEVSSSLGGYGGYGGGGYGGNYGGGYGNDYGGKGPEPRRQDVLPDVPGATDRCG